MKKTLLAVFAIAWAVTGVDFSAQQMWTGKISDTLCSASHTKMATIVFPPLDDPACVAACVDGGGKYVFMLKDSEKAFQIANQDFAELKKHPGVVVNLTGDLKGDVITISKIELAPAQ
jgi:hypothetical protein